MLTLTRLNTTQESNEMNALKAMKQALSWMESFVQYPEDVKENLRTAIEEMEKAEPVAWLRHDNPGGHDQEMLSYEGHPQAYPVYTHPAPIPEGWQLVPKDALEALRHQRQCDEEGVEIAVSRQAVYELLAAAPKPEDE